jgi:aspartokinase/homoserine dehydrogenase 1
VDAVSPILTAPGRRGLRVMKFGGTSVAGAERLRGVVRLVRAALAEDRVLLVVSAMAGVTDLLVAGIEAAESGGDAGMQGIEAEPSDAEVEPGGAESREARGENQEARADSYEAGAGSHEARAAIPETGAAAAGVGGRAAAARRFGAMHREVLADLRSELGPELAAAAARRLAGLEAELARLLAGTAILRSCPEAARARICALGERASCALLGCLLAAGDLPCLDLDPCEVLPCTGDALEATPLPALIRERMAAFREAGVPLGLMPGFFGGRARASPGSRLTPQAPAPAASAGEVMLLGRGGSDLSAALAAAALDARLLEIWTDVDGIFTADPREVPTAACLAELSFDEAMELAHFGAKVLHPRTIAPMRGQGIPVRVCNSFAPERPGTLVHAGAAAFDRPARGVSLMRRVALLDVSGPGMRGVPGMAARVFAALASRDINVVLITQGSSECAISVCVAEQSAEAAVELLEREFTPERTAGLMDAVALRSRLAILSLVGDGMRHQAGVAGALFGALGDLGCNVVAIAQGSSERSISAVIAEEEGARAMEAVHARFFEGCERLELYLMGVGLVGKQLLVQLGRQQERLLARGVELRLCAVANSRRMLVDPAGVAPEGALPALAARGEPLDPAVLRESVRRRRPAGPVLVDCTSSAELAQGYDDFAAAGFHLVSANKKLNSGPLGHYRALRGVLARHRRRFHYETNVGAGLPVINTLRDLLAGGDRVLRIEGILSGSLSFIVGLLEQEVPLSDAVEQARAAGFTEPDPREDLSGLDVGRKALILHRELGGCLELDQVEVAGLLPPELLTSGDLAGFMARLRHLDAPFAARAAELRASGQVLRFIAAVDATACRVGPVAVGPEHPLFPIRDGESAVSFTTAAYSPRPLVVRGYGAGAEVTAAAVLADVMRLLQGFQGATP